MTDVFLCHNSNDKPLVLKIAEALEQSGLITWIDKSNIDPGEEFQRAIEEAIPQTKSAAIFFGLHEEGKWQHEEIQALYREKVNRQIRLIPILLPGVSKIPGKYVFLQGHNWLPLTSEKIGQEFLDKLIDAIKGQNSKSQQTNQEDNYKKIEESRENKVKEKKSLSLSGQQRQKLDSALIDAFPTVDSLEQMLLYELDKNLRAIAAGEGSLQNIVFKLTQKAKAEGWLEDLIRGARNSNPGNPKLRDIAQELIPNEYP